MDYQDYTIEELTKGFRVTDVEVECLHCDATFHLNEVFSVGGKWLNAYGMVEHHIMEAHVSPFHALITLDGKQTGLSDVQREMVEYFYEGLADKEIVQRASAKSISTIRQHRFKLREKEKQAKLFLAMMQLVKDPVQYEIHKGARQVDERYSIEQDEREKVLATYFKDGLDGALELIPSKEKRKLIVLQHILKRFNPAVHYSEKEVNAILKTAHTDYVSLRRYLIEYGFMERSDDGSAYWVKG